MPPANIFHAMPTSYLIEEQHTSQPSRGSTNQQQARSMDSSDSQNCDAVAKSHSQLKPEDMPPLALDTESPVDVDTDRSGTKNNCQPVHTWHCSSIAKSSHLAASAAVVAAIAAAPTNACERTFENSAAKRSCNVPKNAPRRNKVARGRKRCASPLGIPLSEIQKQSPCPKTSLEVTSPWKSHLWIDASPIQTAANAKPPIPAIITTTTAAHVPSIVHNLDNSVYRPHPPHLPPGTNRLAGSPATENSHALPSSSPSVRAHNIPSQVPSMVVAANTNTNATASTSTSSNRNRNSNSNSSNSHPTKRRKTEIKLQDLVQKLYDHLLVHGELDLSQQPTLHLILGLPRVVDTRRLYDALIQLEGFGLVSRSKEPRLYTSICPKSGVPLQGRVQKRKTTVAYLTLKDGKSYASIQKEIRSLQEEEFEAKHHLDQLMNHVVTLLPTLFASQEEFMNFSQNMNLPLLKFD